MLGAAVLPGSNAGARLRPTSIPTRDEGMVGDITELIRRVNEGETGAQDALFAAAYGELRKLARSRLWGGGRNTVLDTTALVHESYLRFVNGGRLRAEDRRAFFAYASRVMRSVIIDQVRERQAEQRGGDQQRVTLNTELVDNLPAGEDEILEGIESAQAYSTASIDAGSSGDEEGGALGDTLGSLDDALEQVENRESLKPLLAQLPERERTILLMRFFQNKTQSEIAAEIGISQMHVSRLLARTLAQLRVGLLDEY